VRLDFQPARDRATSSTRALGVFDVGIVIHRHVLLRVLSVIVRVRVGVPLILDVISSVPVLTEGFFACSSSLQPLVLSLAARYSHILSFCLLCKRISFSN
jgi:hypothetical protein